MKLFSAAQIIHGVNSVVWLKLQMQDNVVRLFMCTQLCDFFESGNS